MNIVDSKEVVEHVNTYGAPCTIEEAMEALEGPAFILAQEDLATVRKLVAALYATDHHIAACRYMVDNGEELCSRRTYPGLLEQRKKLMAKLGAYNDYYKGQTYRLEDYRERFAEDPLGPEMDARRFLDLSSFRETV